MVDIKCTGNNNNGCFMDSCGHNCGCEGLKEFAEKQRENLKENTLNQIVDYLNIKYPNIKVTVNDSTDLEFSIDGDLVEANQCLEDIKEIFNPAL